MSIDVCIKQKGLFKKTIPLDVIVGDELAFGINDGMRMVGDDQEGNMIFYNPNSIGRGFHISWDEDVEETVKELNALGIETEPIRFDTFTGKKMTFFKDPDQLPLEIHE